MEKDFIMHYGNIKYHAIEDGVGIRTALFVSGCRNRCEGCFQPQTWDFDYGEEFTIHTVHDILESLKDPYVAGLSILGGEPFEPENQAPLETLTAKVKTLFPDKDIWVYSGYTFEELLDENSACHTDFTLSMLKNIDILVDGRFMKEKANKMLSYKGSENQRIIDVNASLANNTVVLSEYNERKK